MQSVTGGFSFLKHRKCSATGHFNSSLDQIVTAGIIGSGALDLQGASSPRRVSHAVLFYSIILLMLMQKRNPLWRAFPQITDRLEVAKDLGP